MSTFYLEQKTADLAILDHETLTTPSVDMYSRMANRRISLALPVGNTIPDFIPVTQAEVRRKSLENEILLTRLRKVRDIRRKTFVFAVASSETETVSARTSNTDISRQNLPNPLETRKYFSQSPTSTGGMTNRDSIVRLAVKGKSATTGGLLERFNAAVTARKRFGGDSQQTEERASPRASICALL